jgi:chorismate mutase
MSDTGESDPRALAKLREKIDTIDAEMHRLLIERGSVIDTLIRVKGTSVVGAAFRPMREADMMRRIVARHSGALPIATVEHLWREIITTITQVQAPFGVAVDVSSEPSRMRDQARFTFGFSVDLIEVDGAAAVVEAVAGANNLGVIARAARGPWWRGLVGAEAPKLMALLPFIAATERPADLPAFVISPPLADPTPFDIAAVALTIDGPMKTTPEITILEVSGDDVLIAVNGPPDLAYLNTWIEDAGVRVRSLAAVGGVARGITVDGRPTALYGGVER